MQFLNRKNIVRLVCKKNLQGLMHKLHLLALTGMNYGNANMLALEDTGELEALSYVLKKLTAQPAFIFFDVGANRGDYTKVVISKCRTRELSIFAFEPVKTTYNCLADNVRGNAQVKIFNIGLGDKEETLTIYSNYETSGAATIYGSAHENYGFNKKLSETIHIKTLDGICSEQNIPAIDFLKIDVEGHELRVLQGGACMLTAGKIRFIQFEFGPFNVYSKTFFKDFWDLLSPRYNISRVLRNGLHTITAYSEDLEIFRTANFLAELKDR